MPLTQGEVLCVVRKLLAGQPRRFFSAAPWPSPTCAWNTVVRLVQTAPPLTPERPAWFRVDVFGPDGAPLALTNPIFSGPHQRNKDARFGDYALDLWA